MFSNPLLAPLFLSFLAAFVATLGLLVVAMRSDWSARYAHLFAVMASGILLTMVIGYLAPEALNGHEKAPLFMLGGFFIGLLVHDVLRMVLPVADSRALAAGITPLIAIGIHSFLDGMIYTVTFAQSFDIGLFATLGLIIHEFPEGIVAFALLRSAGLKNRTSFVFAFIASAMTTPLGTLVAIPLTNQVQPADLSVMFAISAGLLLFVSTGPLMAHMHEDKPARTLPALAVGVIIALVVAQTHFAGGHHDGHGHDKHSNAIVQPVARLS